LRRALLFILLATPWAIAAHAAPVTTFDSKAVVEDHRRDAEAGGTLQAAPIEKPALLSRLTDPEPALLGILSLGFAGLLSIRRKRD